MKIRLRRPLCERHERVDVRLLYRSGEIRRGQTQFHFFSGDAVRLTPMPCHFGGSRLAFVCPACKGRVFTLYSRGSWACRTCHGLAYESENATPSDRRLNKAFKIRERLGQTEGGIIGPFPKRPKGRWWHTYLRQRRSGQQLEKEIWRATARYVGL